MNDFLKVQFFVDLSDGLAEKFLPLRLLVKVDETLQPADRLELFNIPVIILKRLQGLLLVHRCEGSLLGLLV